MSDPGWFSDALRNIVAFFDSLGFTIVSAIYNIFFTVANAEIFSGDIMNEFFKRIQLILGVFMIFNLAITALNIIINPDLFSDKQKGAGKIFMKIALSLVMLTLVVPMENIPKDSELNRRISENGILFGFLYQFQSSVMEDNVLGKLVLASNVDSNAGNYGNLDNMSNLGDMLATTVARAFITPALKDTSSDPDLNPSDLKDEDVLCPDILSIYKPNISYKTLLDNINATCDSDTRGEVYMLEYHGIFGLICSVIMALIILGFTVDVAVRAIKLSILRLISPIPIISYIMPGQDKNGSFNNWVKTLTSTYMDLFLRLIIIYFGAYVIAIISEGGINIWQNSPGFFTSLFSSIFLIIGVLIFMKQAPKFFQDILGLQGSGSLFGGIGTVLGAAALTGGLAGSIATGVRAGWSEGAEFREKAQNSRFGRVGGAFATGLTGIKAGLSGLSSGVGGAFTGARTLATTDKKVPSSVISAMKKRNAIRASHSTLPGRIASGAVDMFTGMSLAERDKFALESSQDAIKQMKEWKSFTEGEAIKKGDYGIISRFDSSGHETDMARYIRTNGLDSRILGTRFNYAVLKQRISTAGPSGDFDYNGVTFNARNFDDNIMGEILKNQNHNYVNDVFSGVKDNPGVLSNWELAKAALNKADISYNGEFLDPNDIGKTIGVASSKAQQMQTGMKHIKHIANHNANRSS